MAKTATAEPKSTIVKPSIRFCPAKRQYEAGIDFVQSNGIKNKITHMGYVAISMEDERKLLRMMEVDKFCGITTWENREMPVEQKAAETESRKDKAELAAAKAEMEALRAELESLKGAKG